MKKAKYTNKQAKEAVRNVAQEAKELLDKDRAERIKKCSEEINAILEKHNCVLFPEITMNERGNFPVVRVLAKVEQPK